MAFWKQAVGIWISKDFHPYGCGCSSDGRFDKSCRPFYDYSYCLIVSVEGFFLFYFFPKNYLSGLKIFYYAYCPVVSDRYSSAGCLHQQSINHHYRNKRFNCPYRYNDFNWNGWEYGDAAGQQQPILNWLKKWKDRADIFIAFHSIDVVPERVFFTHCHPIILYNALFISEL